MKIPYREHLRAVKYLAILHLIFSLPFALSSLGRFLSLSDIYSLTSFVGYVPTVLFILYLFHISP